MKKVTYKIQILKNGKWEFMKDSYGHDFEYSRPPKYDAKFWNLHTGNKTRIMKITYVEVKTII